MLDVHPPHSPTHTWKDYVRFLLSFPDETLLKVSDKDADNRFLELEHKTMMQHPDSVPSYANRKGD
jgi:hypothetical protein